MFRSLTIDRFRGFNHLQVDDLDRFSIFLGKNNVGKTAVLEALFLLLGPTNPDLALTISMFRGVDQFKNEPEDLWGWLYYRKHLKSPIRIQAKVDSIGCRVLTMSIEDDGETSFQKQTKKKIQRATNSSMASTSIKGGHLVLNYSDEYKKTAVTKAFVKEQGVVVERKSKLTLPSSIFISSRGGPNAENANRFSALEEIGKEGVVLEALRKLESRLTRLSLLLTSTGPTIHGDIGVGRMVPLPLMGDGIGRLLTLILAIVNAKNGAVLVDEIEVGFHFQVMPTVWKVIAETARECNVQIITTTHSWECIKSAHEAFSESGHKDLKMHRLDREGEEVSSTTYDHEMIETAMLSGIEVR